MIKKSIRYTTRCESVSIRE